MQIGWIELGDYRNYCTLSYSPAPRLNLIRGANAQGKTNLLEALGLLLTGRSFRTFRLGEIPRWGSESASVSGDLRRADGASVVRRGDRQDRGRRLEGLGRIVSVVAGHRVRLAGSRHRERVAVGAARFRGWLRGAPLSDAPGDPGPLPSGAGAPEPSPPGGSPGGESGSPGAVERAAGLGGTGADRSASPRRGGAAGGDGARLSRRWPERERRWRFGIGARSVRRAKRRAS